MGASFSVHPGEKKNAGAGQGIISKHLEVLVYCVSFKAGYLFGMKIVGTLLNKVPEKKVTGLE